MNILESVMIMQEHREGGFQGFLGTAQIFVATYWALTTEFKLEP